MRILKKIEDEFWWDVARTCEYATFYHTPIWKELAERAFPGVYQNATLGAIFPSGVHAVLPIMSKRRRGPLRWLESTYEGCYGGVIADGPITPAETAELYRAACAWSTYSFYCLDNPNGPPLPEELQPQFVCTVSEATYMLKLDADFETICSRFSQTQRSAYSEGLRSGIRVRLANSLDDYRGYYASYQDELSSMGQSGHSGYSWQLFEQLYSLSQVYPDNVKLWLTTVDEHIVGGRFAFYWGQQASRWNGTTHPDYAQHNLLCVADTEIIRDTITQRLAYFDLNTNGLSQEVMRYKEQYGPAAVPVYGWFYEHPLIRSARALSAKR